MTNTARLAVALLAIAAVAGVALPAAACPVCWGASDSPMAQGMNNGIFALLGVIATVQIGFVALFVSFRRRGRAYQEQENSLEAINGGMR